MVFKAVPNFYFSPRVVLLDDDEDLLEIFHESLSTFFTVEIYSHPADFIKRIQCCKNLKHITGYRREIQENASNNTSSIELNYKNLADDLQKSYYQNELISAVFIDYFMPILNGIECAREISDLSIRKILLTASLDDKYVIGAFNEGVIQHYTSKTNNNLVDEMCDTINKSHGHVIDTLNTHFFGEFQQLRPYATLFADSSFINLYHNILIKNSIRFACVYESCGSMIMNDYMGTSYFLNIYTVEEITNILFESDEFEHSISDSNKKLCRDFKLIVDYKNNCDDGLSDPFLSKRLTDTFESLLVGGETYYITLQHLTVQGNIFN